MNDLRRWITLVEGANRVPSVLYRGFGGKGGRYVGQNWGDAVYLTSDLDLATAYGLKGGVRRGQIAKDLMVIPATDSRVPDIAAALSPSAAASGLGVDAIYNDANHWVNKVSPYEFILFRTDAVRFTALRPTEVARYDKLKTMLAEPWP